MTVFVNGTKMKFFIKNRIIGKEKLAKNAWKKLV